jgi:hypothetical protein
MSHANVVVIVNVIKMTNEQKAQVYDECLRESDRLQRENSKLKSEFVGDIPPQVQQQINKNDDIIAGLVGKLESLFR